MEVITVDNTIRICSIDGCENVHRARGFCSAHYNRFWRHGDPLGGGPTPNRILGTVQDRFKHYARWHESGCLVWTGTIMHKGYGTIWDGNKNIRAHRYAWEEVNGPIPSGKVIDHVCHNRACVNVEHLRLCTVTENNQYLSGARAGSKSGVRNVYPSGKGWHVKMIKDGKNYSFGTYSSIEHAAEIAEQARAELFGEFAGRG